MPLLHIAILAAVQGITEFLPISSSAHLVLVPVVMGWEDQGLALDVAAHVGTLGAVALYCWRDIRDMLVGLARFAQGKPDRGAHLAFQLVLATIPAVLAGLLLKKFFPEGIRSITVIAWTTVIYGTLLYAGDRIGMTIRRIEHMTYGSAIAIGLAQALALVPGTSRSGITMTVARFLGFERPHAARFSMLLALPAIAGAGLLEGYELLKAPGAVIGMDAAWMAAFSAVSSFLAILFLMAWLRRASFTPFVIYRLLLGAGLLVYVYALS